MDISPLCMSLQRSSEELWMWRQQAGDTTGRDLQLPSRIRDDWRSVCEGGGAGYKANMAR